MNFIIINHNLRKDNGQEPKTNKKKVSDMLGYYYFKDSKWKEATWPDSVSSAHGNFYFHNNHGIYLSYFTCLTSDKGYEWTELKFNVNIKDEAGSCGNIFMTIPNLDGISLCSLDGISIYQITASEPGDWKCFGFGNNQKVLGIFQKSRHEAMLRLGSFNIVKEE